MKDIYLTYRQREKRKKRFIVKTMTLIKQYSYIQWLETIREINLSHIKDINYFPEFLVVYSDLIIKNAKYESESLYNPAFSVCPNLLRMEID